MAGPRDKGLRLLYSWLIAPRDFKKDSTKKGWTADTKVAG